MYYYHDVNLFNDDNFKSNFKTPNFNNSVNFHSKIINFYITTRFPRNY